MQPLSTVIFVMGPQGSGKGTQAKILAKKLGFFYWGMGEILRKLNDYKFADGKTVGGIINDGNYLSDEELTEILLQKLPQVPQEQGIVFDGMPRRPGQAHFMIEWLKEAKRHDPVTIFLSLPLEESLRRLTLRAQSEHRADDTPEGIALRLKQYEETTLPMMEYMKENTRFIEIDGNAPIPEVTSKIFKALDITD